MENLKLRKKAYDENLDLLKKYREGDALAGVCYLTYKDGKVAYKK
jgi:hypothetical protein